MQIGDVARYRQEFLSPHSGIGYAFADIADICGEIVEIRHNGKIARILWDDGSESSALLKCIEVVQPPSIPVVDDTYHQKLTITRLGLLLQAKAEVENAWNKHFTQ